MGKKSFRSKLAKAFSPPQHASSPPAPAETADGDDLADLLFAQLDGRDVDGVPVQQGDLKGGDSAAKAPPAPAAPSPTGTGSAEASDAGGAANGEKKKSRRDRREEKKASALAALKAEATAELSLPENERLALEAKQEESHVNAICARLERTMHEIAPDGHCLYAAIADQANVLGLEGPGWGARQATYTHTRHLAASYLRAHPDDFLPFLSSASLAPADGANGDGVEAEGDAMTPAQFEDYCARIEQTGEWGGHIEILALSKALRTPIHVVQRHAPSVLLVGADGADEGKDPERVPGLWISYHTRMYELGEHYNSLRPKLKKEGTGLPEAGSFPL